ncbi:protein kinase domain-containing protein [Sulfoacidibacillus thermotolerans]|uniref:Protein kinase domain-containing protein n=1 Tax=Sulfoacidibacillus thermotolerans TaxID=1765684 RepID=A0A2U3DB03_SULT2|nr:phosphotransferase [Sulfoacidibacillus thermotolerans]PWI58459.1 hypothetical protein BM613_02715 [Sulfoacidibacillus thermotolerans]
MSFNLRTQAAFPDLAPGMTLHGQWGGRTYRIIRLLGSGANGKVYLVWRGQERVALKIGEDPTSLALEYEHLREVTEKIRASGIVPQLFELEDVCIGERTYPVLLMEWIDGVDLTQFVSQRGEQWIVVCLWKMLRLIAVLHQQGYAFCDVKPANLLFDWQSASPRLVDFGGVTPIGQAVREYTELYDRAWWGRGTRKADEAYDAFACAMLGLQLAHPIAKGELDRLQKKSPAERSAFLDQQLRGPWRNEGLRRALYEPLQGGMKLESLYVALLPLLHRTNPDHASKAQLPMRRKQRRHRKFDATDWGLLISVIAFTLAMCTLWWIGTL